MNKEFKEIAELGRDISKNKKFQIGLTIVLFLIILFSSTFIRMAPAVEREAGKNPNLVDPTTGDYTMADPDALYFLRLSEVVLEKGNLDGFDDMRSPGTGITYLKEIMPYLIVNLYKIWTKFNPEVSLAYVQVVSNVIFYVFGLIAFFLLVLVLTRSQITSIIATAFLAYAPPYLFRTVAGVTDHDSLGMIGFFFTLLAFVFAIKKHRESYIQIGIWAGLLGLASAFTLAGWAGAVTFLFLILPLSFLLVYMFSGNYESQEDKYKLIGLYGGWILFYLFFSLFFGFGLSDILNRFFSPANMLVPAVLALICVDTGIVYLKDKIDSKLWKYRLGLSAVIVALLGICVLYLKSGGLVSFFEQIYTHLVNPFGIADETGGRLGLTVAENQQPYLVDWIAQTGKVLFYLFVFGIFVIGINISKEIKSLKHKILFVLFWVLALIGILFSRYSSSSLLNGDNFISRLIYIGGFILFASYFAWLYFNDKFKISPEVAIIFSWMIIMILMGRSAARTIFVATPFVCFAAAYFIVEIYNNLKRTKEDTIKYLLVIVLGATILMSAVFLFGNPLNKTPGTYQIVKYQAQNIGPVANYQWISAMQWARENTSEKDIFVHWWDYGYLVQTMGNRPSVSDGGHSAGDGGDYNVGRYVLTTPNPDTALSYMKTWNVSYLLIDPTDLGKYGAYSRIGGDKNHDRYANPAVVVSDPKQIIETSNGTRRIYQGTTFVDDDIKYEDIFLPGTVFDKYQFAYPKSYFIGTILDTKTSKDEKSFEIEQPQAVFLYNNKRFFIPIRNVYYNGRIIDFGKGINSTFMLIPQIKQSATGQIQTDSIGAGIYLSERVQKGLFARLYLMGDPYKQYTSLKEAHVEEDYVVQSLKQQGADLGSLVYFEGLRAPLKIWKVDYPIGTPVHKEFLEKGIVDGYGGLDKYF